MRGGNFGEQTNFDFFQNDVKIHVVGIAASL